MGLHPFLRRTFLSALGAAVVIAGLVAGGLVLTNEARVFFDKEVQSDEPVLWGPAVGQQHSVYKLKRALYLRPEILVLGSSRVTQFRSFMAPEGKSLYNAALAASNFDDAYSFLLGLFAHHRPTVVLLGIDPWWFDARRATGQTHPLEPSFDLKPMLAEAIRALARPTVLAAALSPSFETESDSLGGRRPVGFLAADRASGFRPDGSYQYGEYLADRTGYAAKNELDYAHGFRYHLAQVKASSGRFEYVGPPAQDRIARLRDIIELGKRAGVRLVLFMPPMARAVYKKIQSVPAQSGYLAQVIQVIAMQAQETETPFFDFTNLSGLGIEDYHTIDGIHVDEIATLAMLIRMIDAGSALGGIYSVEDRDKFHHLVSGYAPQAEIKLFQP